MSLPPSSGTSPTPATWWSPRQEGPWFEVAIIHHTDCGSTLLADDELRHGFGERIGVDERTLTDTPVLDPERMVSADVDRVL